MKGARLLSWGLVAWFAVGSTGPLWGAPVGAWDEPGSLAEQAGRFFSLSDPSVRYAVLGSILLGISCGLLGSFIVVRRLALMGDALSHAVLPGVAVGFLWRMEKDPALIFMGAVAAGLLGTMMVTALTRTTRLKEDAALGLVLASFFGVGLVLVSRLQRMPGGNVSGLDSFLFGQVAALGAGDIRLMAVVTGLVVLLTLLAYKELLAVSFDPLFARVIGLPVVWVHHGMMLMLAAAVVIALQAVGVVLVSAMLITPAATAQLLTHRLHRMLMLAAAIGAVTGVTGAFLSFLGRGLPTGPLMVLGASLVFVGVWLGAPRQGLVARWWRQRRGASRIRRENTLKSIYHVAETEGWPERGVSLHDLAARRRETLTEAAERVAELDRHGWATPAGDVVYFTPAGRRRAGEIVRNHRLWELYLTDSAQLAADHVHEDAEKIEHVLGETTVRALERRLNHARRDPHGRPIPGPEEIVLGRPVDPSREERR
jgi:manganese/zinc/iron transport system permease protein